MSKRKGVIQVTGLEDIFSDHVESGETITRIPVKSLRAFQNHPFRVVDDAKMEETVESVKQRGVLVPILVRPYSENQYEVISGHRRWRASFLAGLKNIPAIIRKISDDDAVVIMVDSNIQREDILPSEKAKAYAMKYKALKHQGSKGGKYTADLVGETAGESGRTVQRYIRLAELSDPILSYVDRGKISLGVGEILSYLNAEEQTMLYQIMDTTDVIPDKCQAEQLRKESTAGRLREGTIYSVLCKRELHQKPVTLTRTDIKKYFPVNFTNDQIKTVIYQLLDEWTQKQS
ncbi:MAG: ParB/RepB/Spo0J family partition protein [Ruminococcus sp.]|nr:ParB/RepB/Spo0J family partition protein [Ruminococcus sp.]